MYAEYFADAKLYIIVIFKKIWASLRGIFILLYIFFLFYGFVSLGSAAGRGTTHAQDHRRAPNINTQLTRRLRAISAARLPHVVLLTIFEYLSLKDLAQCMRVCKHWWTVLQYPVSFHVF